MKVKFKISGLEEVRKNLTRAALLKYTKKVKQCAEVVAERSQEYVPVETGELKESMKIVHTKTGYDVVYDSEHALPVHEDMEAMHAEPTCAKYLERALNETARERSQILSSP